MTTFLSSAFWQRVCNYLAQAQLQAELGNCYQPARPDTAHQPH